MTVDKNINQKQRLWILVFYIMGLMGTSKIALSTWLPPTAEKGVWFYSALAALLLGNLIVTPYFTKPADAISYSVSSFVALLAVNVWLSPALSGFDRLLWSLAVGYAILVLILSILAIVLKDSVSLTGQRFGRLFFELSNRMGQPKAIFSIVFIFALLTYHRNVPREYLTISIAWVIFVVFKPLEYLIYFIKRFKISWAITETYNRLGQIVGHETPNILLIREDDGRQARFGDIILARTDYGQPGLALALDHVGFAEGRWLRAVHLLGAKIESLAIPKSLDNVVFLIDPSMLDQNAKNLVAKAKNYLIGIVASGTTIERLNIEILKSDLSITSGSLVEVVIGTRKVLYQIIDGITQEEIIQQKNTRGFVCAHAKKIGSWNAEERNFEPVPWLPQPNEMVFLVCPEQQIVEKDAIGHFPGTSYPVCIDPHLLVTHNAAILGILGVGKSFLALELVERMINAGIKVVCLDLTNQYAEELSLFFDNDTENEANNKLKDIGQKGKLNFQRNVEEGGSIQEFTIEVEEQLEAFLDPNNESKIRIFNPTQFEVWRQDSKQHPDGRAAMATLTPTEITRIITEAVLKILQTQGITDRARCCIVYEEAHSLIPEWNAVASEGDKTATSGTAKAILQGRKFGLGCIVVTQRTANVTKSILNQCNTVFALRVFDATGMEFLKNYIGEDYAGVLSTLEDRHAVVFGRASMCRDPVLTRLNDRNDFIEVFRE